MDLWPQLNFVIGSGWLAPLWQLLVPISRIGLAVALILVLRTQEPRWAAPALALALIPVAVLWSVQVSFFNPLIANLMNEPDPRTFVLWSRWLSPLAWAGSIASGIVLLVVARKWASR